MDTPERSKIAGAPISKFEDSPIFNFINNLSPIQPVKSVHGAQSFPSLSYASISSVFSSPHVNSQKESRFLIRQPSPDSSKFETSSESVVENNLCTGLSNVTKLFSYSAVAQEKSSVTCLLNEATVDPPDECLTQPSNLAQSQYDCGSPNHNMTPSYGIKVDPKINTDHALDELVPFVPDGVERRKILFATEIELQEKHQQEGSEQDVAECDWEDLISNDADEMLIFDSPIESETCKDQDENLEDKANTLSSSISQLTDVVDIPQNKSPEVSYDLCLKNATEDPIVDNSGDVGEQHGVDCTPQIFSGTSQKQAVLSDQTQKIGKGNNTCTSFVCKVDSQHHRGMRRRCLVFEVSGASGKKSNNNSTFQPSVSYSLPSTGKFTSEDRRLTLLRPGSSLSSRMLPGIGLHLNTLATVSKDRKVAPETPSSGRCLVSMPCTISPFPPLRASKSLDTEKDQCRGNEVRDFEDVHNDSCEVPTVGVREDLNHSSPKKKKRRSDNGGESEACKRCNCKKSKCLKLYCECFAAGIYCVEPCSCQGCFNKPVHEEIVLATRKQIESRNPLAFAPKVIRASEPVQDPGEETNNTPASARHKRGCNCKKSSCLKKYCECYQSGVGCSASCRCEGCKNAFGRKDGADEIEHEEEEKNDCGKQRDESDASQQNAVAQNDEHPLADNILAVSPCFQICSPSVQLPFLSSGKPPRSSLLPVGYQTSKMRRKCDVPLPRGKIDKHFKTALDDDTPEILRNDSSPSAGVKTCSPNGKRVSPPHISLGMSPNRKGARKLILKSIPSFPSLSSTASGNYTVNYSSSSFGSSTMS
ncbi:protein tesmin/TSO1-like CXC 2 [Iris pallida]|uniref:Protein tesmin/TSO1-like CXC 2 n=1 Tax=Iris pallida TaxID=29817 RepID=A0AAX6FLM2_IRIPA|nr:protein tesmin/TSO1-like CXC 2 [Iris pallida]